MHFFKNSGKFYYLLLTPAGEILEGNNCFFSDIEAGSSTPEEGKRALFLPDFLSDSAAQELRKKLQQLATQPAETRFDAHFRLYYSPDTTHYVLTDWEFCKTDAGITAAGSRAVTQAAQHPLAPAGPGSQELFEVFLQQSDNIVTIKDSNGAYLSASPAFYRHFNIPEGKLIGRRDSEILGSKLGRQCTQSDAATLEKGITTFHVEYDEEGRQYEVTKFPFTLSSGQRVIGGIMRETTEQLNMDNRLRYIAEQVPGLLFEFHQYPAGKARRRPGYYSYISPKIYDYTGYTAEEVIDDYIIPYDLIHSEDRPHVKQRLAEAKRRVQACTLEYRSYHRSAPGMRWLRSVSQPAPQPDGSLIWYGIVTDITSIKEKEEALRGAEHRFHLVAENIADGIVVFDQEKRIIYASASFYKQFNLLAGSLTGMNLDEVLSFVCAEDRPR
ncbi:MAG: PAS domain S-box protein, partial [Cyclonatronaceae bacterium]